jgi:hypothetical protein
MTMGKWNWIGEIWSFHSINVEDLGFIGCYAVAAQYNNAADSFTQWQRLNEFILSCNDRNNQILHSTDDKNGTSFCFRLMTDMDLVSAFNRWQKQPVYTFSWWKMDPCFHLMTEKEPVFKVLCFHNHSVPVDNILCVGSLISVSILTFWFWHCVQVECFVKFSVILAVAIFGMELIEGISNPHVLHSTRTSCRGM